MANKIRKLHIGCCLNTPEDWINLDGSFNALLAKFPIAKKILAQIGVVSKEKIAVPWSRNILVHDVRKPLPFEDNSMDAVYTSHLLEHIYYNEAERLLKECYRVLSPGGVLRVMVPDVQDFVSLYLKQKQGEIKIDKYPADVLMENLLLRSPKAPAGNWIYRIYDTLKDFHSHKWMYDQESLEGCFKKAGFLQIGKKSIGESRIKNINIIELNNGLCVEGIK